MTRLPAILRANLVWSHGLALLLAGALLACGGPKPIDGDEMGGGNVTGGGGRGGSGASLTNVLGGAGGVISAGGSGGQDCQDPIAVMRDFLGFPGPNGEPKHPDFEGRMIAEKGLVKPDLGDDSKPVYAYDGPSPKGTVSGPESFDQWYRDVDDVNKHLQITLPLKQDAAAGAFVYDNQAFFPIDDQGWGNQDKKHNFHFTTEIHTKFTYKGGERFTFIGDDDVFLFVNKKLAVDLGGVHNKLTGVVDFDAQAANLGIEKGNTYEMDVFHAERHTTESHFRMETTIDCFVNVLIQ